MRTAKKAYTKGQEKDNEKCTNKGNYNYKSSCSVPRTTKCPPSLLSIYKALENDPEVTFTKP